MKHLSRLLAGLALFALSAALRAEITVVQVAPLSGPLASTGRGLMLGAQAYFDKLNRQGGVAGQKVRLLTRDDGYRAEDTVRLVKESLASDNPVALLGLVGTGNLAALLKDGVLDRAAVPVVGVRTGARALREGASRYVFHARAGYDDEVRKMIGDLTTVGLSRIAVFYQDDPFGGEVLASVEASLKEKGTQPVARGTYPKNTTDVAKAVSGIMAADPQVVILGSNTLASAAFVKGMRTAGYHGLLYAVSVTDPFQVWEQIGASAAHGLVVSQVMPNPARSEVPLVREAAQALAVSAPGTRLSYPMVEGYIYAKILAEGLRRSGGNPNRNSLLAGLEKINRVDLGGLTVDYGSHRRNGASLVYLTMMQKDGSLLQ